MIGRTVSHYRILEKLGEGGMGVVYKALDTHLDRLVAIKFLPPAHGSDPERRRRLEQEAKAASSLNHPHIVTIHDITQDGADDFLVMEYVAGRTLGQMISEQGLAIDDVLNYAVQVAGALAAAHEAGILHRDIKPSNVMVNESGTAKVLDFGLAKLVAQASAGDAEASARETVTAAGAVLGTAAYMSPEQAEGKPVDARTDVFSFGALLYEMLTGVRVFQRESAASTLAAVLRETPAPVRTLRRDAPEDLHHILRRCLEKNRDDRYPSAAELHRDLAAARERRVARRAGLRSLARQPQYAIPAIVVLLALLGLGGWYAVEGARARRERAVTLPEVARLIGDGKFETAFKLVRRAERVIPGDPELQRLKRASSVLATVGTTPPGANVYWRSYSTDDGDWELLGASPVKGALLPRCYVRWKIAKEGFEPVERAGHASVPLQAALTAKDAAPAGMVKVDGGPFQFRMTPQAQLEEYWLDRYEVTNRQYKEFVDRGGYQKEEFWKQPFVESGRRLSWKEAMARFRDATGMPGPATWEVGTYPEEQAEYPVGGVSWYEAAAYAEFAGKSLPTVYHWYRATGAGQGLWLYSDILLRSNFGGKGPAPVGSYQGLAPFGSYDMAGNLKEWCWNQAGVNRYILGGAWNEPTYAFDGPDAQSPFARSPTCGFRCAKYSAPLPEALLAPMEALARDYSKAKPVGDDVYRVYRSLYAYDRTPLNAVVEATDDSSPDWRREKVTFDAAYPGERVIGILFLPRQASPPFQTVVYYPGASAFLQKGTSDNIRGPALEFIMRSGRALLYPVYKWSYERGGGRSGSPSSTNFWRDFSIVSSKDLGRSVDYLVSRPDIDGKRLAYYGMSLGALLGPVLTAVDDRFRAVIFEVGGLPLDARSPESDPINFAPRVRAPALMINGRHDFSYPLESSQLPLFRLLGAAPQDKRHALFDAAHSVARNDLIKELLAWLDRCLGPVRTRPD